MELRQYFALFRRWWWLIVLLTALGAGTAFGLAQFREPVYQATTTVLINQAPGALPDADAVIQAQRVASTYAELLQQRPVLEQVIENLNLTMSPEDLDKRVSVSRVGDTNLLDLTVEDINPHQAANIANEIVNVFISQNLEFQESRYASSLENLQTELDDVQLDIDRAEARLEEFEESPLDLTAEEIAERDRLQDLLAEYQSNYSMLLDRFEEVRLAQAQTTDKISVVEVALPGSRAGQSSLVFALQGAMVGAALAFGVVLLTEYLNDTVRSDDEAEVATGVSTLGVIGTLHKVENLRDALVTATHPRSANAEAYRVLRANLDSLSNSGVMHSIMVTSTGPMEGKTTTAANLAVALAQAGKRVILVDMDLRRPTLHKLFEVSNRQGVTTALLQPEVGRSRDHILATDVENLYLMPSGPLPPNPADLLESPQAFRLVEELESYADVVIFDTPPVLAVADPSLLARLCDAVLLVVLADQTKAVALRKAREQLAQTGVDRLGVVLNRVSSSRDGYYYRYHYYYASEVENGTKS